MKIYHKKNFGTGLLLLLMGLRLLCLGLTKGMTLNRWWTVFLCLFFGGGLLLRSLSREFSREDRLEELDERNRYIALRTAQRAFQVTQTGCFALMALCFILSSTRDSEILTGAALGLAGAWVISVLGELMAALYYEHRC